MINILKKLFWGNMWAYFTLIATIEVIIQGIFCIIENKYSWHITFWIIWLSICIFIRIKIK